MFRRFVLFYGLCAALLCGGLPAAWSQSAANDGPGRSDPITSVTDFWDRELAAREAGLPLALEVDVTYYDPSWNVMWIHDGTVGEYAEPGPVLPIHAGQRIRLTGLTAPPFSAFSIAAAEVELLGPARVNPTAIDLTAIRHADWLDQPVTLHGLVDTQSFDDESHLHLRLVAQGQAVNVWVMVDPRESVPQFVGANVAINGIYTPRFAPSGEVTSIELFCPGLSATTVTGWLAEDPRFNAPAERIEALGGLPADEPAHVRGRVVARLEDGTLRVRDDTGQVEVHTGQRSPFAVGEPVEVVGYPVREGVMTRLNQSLVRRTDGDARAPRGDTPLLHRLAAPVLELTPEEASRGDEVRLNGVVTWSSEYSPYLFVQDSSGGVRVLRSDLTAKVEPIGQHVEVRGRTELGDFAPVVVARSIKDVGEVDLPIAKAITLEHALTGVEEAQWVALTGYIRNVRRDGYWTRLELSTTAGEFTARTAENPGLANLVGSVVTLRGVCTAVADDRRKLTSIELWISDETAVKVEESVPDDLFALPATRLADLGRFSTAQNLRRRLKVIGTVLLQTPSGSIHLEDEGDALRLIARRDGPPVAPGDRIEAVGFFGRDGVRPVLRETVYRRIGHEPPSVPEPLAPASDIQPDLDGRPVVITGRLVDLSLSQERAHLTLQHERHLFDALLQYPATAMAPETLTIGSELRITGVYVVEYNELAEPAGFSVLVPQPAAIEVLSRPSWFTRGRVLALSLALLVGVALSLFWATTLRRRISYQSVQIQQQLARESELEAELHRAARLDSLGGLASGIARDFNHLIGVISRDVAAVRGDRTDEPVLREAAAAAERARELTRRLLTLAKGSPPARSAIDPATVVRRAAESGLANTRFESVLEFAPDVWLIDADGELIAQVVANITTNAVEAMSAQGQVRFTLHNELVDRESKLLLPPGPYVRLAVIDHGNGIPANILPRLFDPYFSTRPGRAGLGLSTAYSIVRKHGGHISAESTPMIGTTVRVWLPAAPRTASAPAADA